MPDEQPSTPVESTPTEPSSEGRPASETTSESTASAPPEWLQDPDTAIELIMQHHKDKVLQHRSVTGYAGEIGRRRAEQIVKDQRERDQVAERLQKAQAGEYTQLGREEAQRLLIDAESRRGQEAQQHVMADIKAFQDDLPDEVQQKIAGKEYPGGVKEYMAAAVEAAVDHKFQAAVDKEISKRLPALRKQWLAESQSGEGSPEPSGGVAANGHRTWTREEVLGLSPAEYRKNRDSILAALK